MRRLLGAAILAALSAPAAPAEEAPPGQRRIFEDYGNLTVAESDEAGTVWLALWDDHVRFRLDGESRDRLPELRRLIERAYGEGRAVTIVYDGSLGRVDRASGTLQYPLCGITMDDLAFAPTHPCATAAPEPPASAEVALPLANAHAKVANFRLAETLLERRDLPDDPAFRRLFLRIHARIEEGIASEAGRRGPQADRAFAAALADHRALARLEPEQADHQFAIASALADLGGYADAEALYRRILEAWPDEDFRVSVNRAALHRFQGQYGEALDALDRLVARGGPQEGMKFHYHRGWLLTLLGRHEEAVAEFTQGLADQPDYSSAYIRRACALAGMGRLREALDDVGKASRLYADLPGAATSKWLQDDIAEAAGARKRLEAALAQGVDRPLTGLCAGPAWRGLETPRPRSPLLPSG